MYGVLCTPLLCTIEVVDLSIYKPSREIHCTHSVLALRPASEHRKLSFKVRDFHIQLPLPCG